MPSSKRTRQTFLKEIIDEQPEYKKIKSELQPFITKITKVTEKRSQEYQRFKENIEEWNRRFAQAAEIAETVDSIQQFQIPLIQKPEPSAEDRRLLSVLGLYRYLGLVESMGTTILDLVALILIADGCELHVERIHDVPRIVHASSFDDLDDVRLAEKIAFLERNNLTETSKLVDKELRNAIAHLNFRIDSQGKVMIPTRRGWKEVDIYQQINTHNRRFTFTIMVLSEGGLGEFWSKKGGRIS